MIAKEGLLSAFVLFCAFILVASLIVLSSSSSYPYSIGSQNNPPLYPYPVLRVDESDIFLSSDTLSISVTDPLWVVVANTGSMEPTLRTGSHVIEKVPSDSSEMQVGDIISFHSDFYGKTLIHRIVEVGHDQIGWYARTKGDANADVDEEYVRFWNVKGIVVAITY
ncbi:MAG TPA: signal peptidase I [Acidobacteriota bacterium]|nr:signal peptidase I [Acidobacteriota bacterium]